MGFKYDKDTLKENLTIEEVFDLVSELGGEPTMTGFPQSSGLSRSSIEA